MSRVFAAGFVAVRSASKDMGEYRDCTVRALTIATGREYADCHAAMKAQGRKNRRGSSVYAMVAASKALGYHMTALAPRTVRAKTMRTIERDSAVSSGNFIVAMAGHVGAVQDGKVIDHTEGRLNRIQKVYSITPIAGFVAPLPITVPAHQWAAIPQQLALI